MQAAWNETEKEHRGHVAERIKRRNRKLDEAYSHNGNYLHQWVRQDYQAPIATMKKSDGCVTMNFQEIHQTLTEAWRPIFARWDRGAEPQYAKFKERFGQFNARQPMDVKMLAGVGRRNSVQRWSNNAAAGG